MMMEKALRGVCICGMFFLVVVFRFICFHF